MVKVTHYEKIVLQKLSSRAYSFKLLEEGRYLRVRDVAAACGVKIPPRRAFGYINKNIAVICIHLDEATHWKNELNAAKDIIREKKLKGESPEQFQKRVCGNPCYDVSLSRLFFVKEKQGYKFVGVFRVTQFDFENRQVVFKKVYEPKLTVKTHVRKTITIEIENELEVNIE